MIITFATSKGGAGKSTSCACLAGAFIAQGQSVHIVDLDGNHTISRWLTRQRNCSVSTPDPQHLTEHLTSAADLYKPDHILIDLAGAYEAALTVAAARAHLTIIPAAPAEADLHEASRTARHVRDLYAAFNRQPLYRLLLTKVQPIASHAQSHALKEVERLALPRFDTMLGFRAAYQEIGLSGEPPHLADHTRPTVGKAVSEIDAWLAEINVITTTNQERTAA